MSDWVAFTHDLRRFNIYLVHVFAAESNLAYLKLERHAEKIEIKNRDTHRYL